MIVWYCDLVNLKNLIVEGSRLDFFFHLDKSFDNDLINTIGGPCPKGILNGFNWSWVTWKFVVDVFDLFWEIVQVFEEFKLEVPKKLRIK